jgi:hypothetical protein
MAMMVVDKRNGGKKALLFTFIICGAPKKGLDCNSFRPTCPGCPGVTLNMSHNMTSIFLQEESTMLFWENGKTFRPYEL